MGDSPGRLAPTVAPSSRGLNSPSARVDNRGRQTG